MMMPPPTSAAASSSHACFLTPLSSTHSVAFRQNCTNNYSSASSSSRRRWNRSLCSTTSSSSISSSDETKMSAKEKRKKLIGLAKAVDRGQFQNSYSPGGKDGVSFVAKSGLPDTNKLFCVLGIESSCDDTGGEDVIFVEYIHIDRFFLLFHVWFLTKFISIYRR